MVEMKIQWLKPALEDLWSIRLYYEKNASITVARKRVEDIMKRVSLLSLNPNLGKLDEVLHRETEKYRFLVCGDYKVYYYIKDDVVKIALLWDCRQNPKSLTDRFK